MIDLEDKVKDLIKRYINDTIPDPYFSFKQLMEMSWGQEVSITFIRTGEDKLAKFLGFETLDTNSKDIYTKFLKFGYVRDLYTDKQGFTYSSMQEVINLPVEDYGIYFLVKNVD